MREWDDSEPLGLSFRIEATLVIGLVGLGLLFISAAAISCVVRLLKGIV